MRIVKLAAGLAAGYVLGARAGREKYERIAAAVRTVSSHGGVAASPADVATIDRPTPAVTSDKPRRPRNRRPKAATTTPSPTDESPAMSAAKLDLDAVPMEAAEADVIEQRRS